jgi:hypothetical protein
LRRRDLNKDSRSAAQFTGYAANAALAGFIVFEAIQRRVDQAVLALAHRCERRMSERCAVLVTRIPGDWVNAY